MTALQREITQFMTLQLEKPLRDKISSSEAMQIVKAVELFIVSNGYTRPDKPEDTTSHNFMQEIEKI